MKTAPYDQDDCIGRTVRQSVDEWFETVNGAGSPIQHEAYRRHVIRKIAFILVCVMLAILISGYAFTIGNVHIGFVESYRIIWEHYFGEVTDIDNDYFLFHLRIPRVVIGLIAGAGLAVAGAVMQSVLKNPLADSYTTGVSSGALFGVSIGLILGMSMSTNTVQLFVLSFVFSMIPTGIIVLVSRLKNGSPTTMIMAGIAVMYIFNACTTLIKLSVDPDSLSSIYKWQVGSLTLAGSSCIPLMLSVTVICTLVLQFLSREINVLNSGDDTARAMGVDADTLRIICLVLCAVMSAVIVSFVGLIGFVGLVAPHMVRMFIGPDNRFLILGSAFLGAVILVLADLIGRTIIAPAVIQVGVITAFFGGPLFLWLILRRGSKVW